MKKFLFVLFILSFAVNSNAENYLLNGGQESRINYKMVQTVEPKPDIHTLYLSYVIPATYKSPTYNQTITNLNFEYTPQPDGKEEFTDKRGNKVIKLSWEKPQSTIKTVISLTALNKTILKKLETKTPFPFSNVPADIKPYITATSVQILRFDKQALQVYFRCGKNIEDRATEMMISYDILTVKLHCI